MRTLIGSASVVEARRMVQGRRGPRTVVPADDLLRLPLFEIVGAALAAVGRSGGGAALKIGRDRTQSIPASFK